MSVCLPEIKSYLLTFELFVLICFTFELFVLINLKIKMRLKIEMHLKIELLNDKT